MVDALKSRLKRLKSAAGKEPPAALTYLMDDVDPHWRDSIRLMDAEYTTPAKVDIVKAVLGWLEHGFASDSDLYIRRQNFLLREFDQVLESPLLVDPRRIKK
jgi:hypothetical protein